MDIIFTGYYGQQNIGDDVFCVVMHWGARLFWGKNSVGLLAATGPLPRGGVTYMLSHKQLFPGQRTLEVALAMGRTRWMVFGGGSLFHRPMHILSARRFMTMYHDFAKMQLGAVGVSIGPFTSKKAMSQTIDFLRRFSFLCVRDRRSFDAAQEMQLPFQPVEARDLAFLLPRQMGRPVLHTETCDSRPILGIALCCYESYGRGDLSNEMRRLTVVQDALVGIAGKGGCRLRYFVFNGSSRIGDWAVTKNSADMLRGVSGADIEVIPYTEDVAYFWGKICECTAFLSIRLHGAILACAAKVPFMLVEYHRKCTDYLDDCGQSHDFRIGDAEVSPDDLSKKLETLLNNPSRFSFARLDLMQRMAMLNFARVPLALQQARTDV
jgi:polysaccharide pyruvyl transferase WcaK-like protein